MPAGTDSSAFKSPVDARETGVADGIVIDDTGCRPDADPMSSATRAGRRQRAAGDSGDVDATTGTAFGLRKSKKFVQWSFAQFW